MGTIRMIGAPSMIGLRKVSKEYRQGRDCVRALAGVDLTVEAGEFVSMVGPSGSGKSTLLHLIGGLDRPSAGEIWVQGRALARMSDDEITVFRRRHVGFVFQSFNLLPALSAAENIALPLLLDGKRMRDVRPRVERLLDLVGLARRAEHRPDELSGGETQRVAIARALVTEPLLLLADEPTGNLDRATGDTILDLIRHANRSQGQTVVLVTHDPHAAAYGDRTVTVRDGRISAEVRPDVATGLSAS
jgi:putative ABC transport system ATP-binding protein